MMMAGRRSAPRARGAPVDDDALGDARRLVERFRDRLAFHQVLERDGALDLREDRPRIGIPLGDALAALDLVAVVDAQPRAVLDAVHRAFGAVRIDHRHHEVAAHRDQIAIGVARDVLVLDLDLPFEIRLDEGLLRDLRRAADMERAHGELRARLADRLGRDHADRLAHVDRRAAREIASVAGAADAGLGLAGEHRADAHLLDAGLVDHLDMRLLDQGAALDHDLVGRRDRADPRPWCGPGYARRARPPPDRRR